MAQNIHRKRINLTYDCIVVGAGHAGTEAALSASRMGCKTALVTMNLKTLGHLSCNPAIGGIGKGQLVKEIDATGGEMAKAADYAGIQFRILNSSKGPAVHSSRAQQDRTRYKKYIKRVLRAQKNLTLIEAKVTGLLVKNKTISGVKTDTGETIKAKKVIISPGTFLNGLIHIGLKNHPGGRIGEPSAPELSESLKKLGFKVLRFKTGTCARLDGRTIDFSKLQIQKGDASPVPFSFSTRKLIKKQVPCYITYTNKNTHEIIQSGLDKSPLYRGVITGTGVRYCPSIEDKVVKFSGRERHQIFLEPEGLDTHEYYPNGLSTSLPEDIQLKFMRSIKGLEKVKPAKIGYGIEHDLVDPTQLYPTLETKLIKNLYLAGQINGTTGYEEAAAQGLIAGINAALGVKGKNPLVLDRSTSYIGVLIDDLVTKGTAEPYRMFTSRVEYRLLIREDNADIRLSKIGFDLGLISKKDYNTTNRKERNISSGAEILKNTKLTPTEKTNRILKRIGTTPLVKAMTAAEVLKRPGLTLKKLKKAFKFNIPDRYLYHIEIEIKYSDFIDRQIQEVKRFKNLEKIKIPEDFNYNKLPSLSKEIREKLVASRPVSLGQASRISGITPVSLSLLMVYLKKDHDEKRK